MPTKLPQDLPRLRSEFSTKLAGCGTATRAAGKLIYEAVESLWDDDQGIPDADA